ncbi:MAG: hypothetical protein ABTQ25_10535 [Nitrosomonas ureae]
MSDWIMYQTDGVTDRCPVPEDMLIEIMMLDGEVWNDELAGSYNWAVIDEPGEIIAYRLLVEAEPMKTNHQYERVG